MKINAKIIFQPWFVDFIICSFFFLNGENAKNSCQLCHAEIFLVSFQVLSQNITNREENTTLKFKSAINVFGFWFFVLCFPVPILTWSILFKKDKSTNKLELELIKWLANNFLKVFVVCCCVNWIGKNDG